LRLVRKMDSHGVPPLPPMLPLPPLLLAVPPRLPAADPSPAPALFAEVAAASLLEAVVAARVDDARVRGALSWLWPGGGGLALALALAAMGMPAERVRVCRIFDMMTS
jgi:hypothetical protein